MERTILVVEDDDCIREAVEMILEMRGYRVLTATDGAAGLQLLRQAERLPDLILLDLNMPVMSGDEFLQHVRTEGGRVAQIPTVVMTAVRDAQVTGVAGFLRKPVDLDDIINTVGSFLPALAADTL